MGVPCGTRLVCSGSSEIAGGTLQSWWIRGVLRVGYCLSLLVTGIHTRHYWQCGHWANPAMSTQILKRKRFTRVALEFSTYLVFTETGTGWGEKEFDGALSSVAVWDGPTTARNIFVGARVTL